MTKIRNLLPITLLVTLITVMLMAVTPAAAQLEEFDALMDDAIDAYFEGDYDSALEIIEEALDSTDDDLARSFALDWRGWIYYILGDDSQAIDDLDEAIDISAENVDPIYYIDRAMIYAANGRNREALEDYSRAVELDPTYSFDPEVLVSTSSADFLIENYTIANDARKDNYVILAFRGTMYANVGNFEEAAADLERALELNPNFDLAADILDNVLTAQQTGFNPQSCSIAGTGIIPLITFGESVEGTISSETPYEMFCVNVTSAPVTLSAEMNVERGSLEPVVAFYIFGTSLGFSDPTSDETATVEVEITVPGLYTVLAGREDFEEGRTTGTYSLTVEISGGSGQITKSPNTAAHS